MRKVKYGAIIIFFITVFISSEFITNVFATHAELQEIKKLEEMQKVAPSEITIRPRVEYKAEDLRDPFQKPYTEPGKASETVAQIPESQLSALTVQGVVWGGNFPLGIINNKVLKVGDTIEGARIVDINKDGITLFFQGQQYKLSSPAAGGNGPAQKP